MAHVAIPASTADRPYVLSVDRAAAVPWYIWCAVIAVTSVIVGAHWDISWHRSIGRDSFWTPAHMAIYACGVLAGIVCGYLILSTTFGNSSFPKEATVRMWGFRGPLGAFVAAWGGVTMLVSAPFDNWWHSAYGLDVKIVSPPHVVLIAGVLAVQAGTLILVLGQMNRSQGKLAVVLNRLFLYVAATIMVILGILLAEYTARFYMHSATFYRVVCTGIPVLLAAMARASRQRWAATIVTGLYTLFLMSAIWILPLFPAVPKLGPVYQNVTHFEPMDFPLLFIVPAIVLDLLWARLDGWNKWAQALIAGAVFLVVFLAAQWPFADFLNSPASRNDFWGTNHFGYQTRPDSIPAQYKYFVIEKTAQEFWKQMGIAMLISIFGMRIGFGLGDWMRTVRR